MGLEIVGIFDICRKHGQPSIVEENGIVIDNIIIEEMLVDRRSEYPGVFLIWNRIPRFWSQNDNRHDEKDEINGGASEPSILFRRAACIQSFRALLGACDVRTLLHSLRIQSALTCGGDASSAVIQINEKG